MYIQEIDRGNCDYGSVRVVITQKELDALLELKSRRPDSGLVVLHDEVNKVVYTLDLVKE